MSKQPERSLPVVASRTVSLRSGGSVSLRLVDTNVFELERRDREFLEELLKHAEAYEADLPRDE
jgi:hypothetical protein